MFLLQLQDTPTDSVRYNELIRNITANFDEFKESSSHNVFNKHTPTGHTPNGNNNNSNTGSGENGAASRQEADAAFLNYTYKRKPVSFVTYNCLCVVFFLLSNVRLILLR